VTHGDGSPCQHYPRPHWCVWCGAKLCWECLREPNMGLCEDCYQNQEHEKRLSAEKCGRRAST